jgi:hypothetical protein
VIQRRRRHPATAGGIIRQSTAYIIFVTTGLDRVVTTKASGDAGRTALPAAHFPPAPAKTTVRPESKAETSQ